MTAILSALLPIVLAAQLDVPAGADLGEALARAREGDVVRLGEGIHAGSLGRHRASIRIEGAGTGRTEVIAPEGEDGIVVDAGEVTLSGLALRAGPARSALKVLGGTARLEGVLLEGGAVGAYVDGGRVEGREVDLAGGYGLLARSADVVLTGGTARGAFAGLALLSGALRVERFSVTGPSREAGVTVSGGEAILEGVVIRSPGPSGIAIAPAGKVRAVGVAIAGAQEVQGILGDCVLSRRGDLALEGGVLALCGGAAVEAAGGTVDVRGVHAAGGQAGCIVLVEGVAAELVGNVCGVRGPSVVAASGAKVHARMNQWRTDPVLWVDCGSGARIELGIGERVAEPCRPSR